MYARDSNEKVSSEERASDREGHHTLYPPKDLPIPRPHCLTRSGEWFPWPYEHRKGTIFGGVGDTCLRCRRLETGPKCRGSFRLTTKVCHGFVSTRIIKLLKMRRLEVIKHYITKLFAVAKSPRLSYAVKESQHRSVQNSIVQCALVAGLLLWELVLQRLLADPPYPPLILPRWSCR